MRERCSINRATRARRRELFCALRDSPLLSRSLPYVSLSVWSQPLDRHLTFQVPSPGSAAGRSRDNRPRSGGRCSQDAWAHWHRDARRAPHFLGPLWAERPAFTESRGRLVSIWRDYDVHSRKSASASPSSCVRVYARGARTLCRCSSCKCVRMCCVLGSADGGGGGRVVVVSS